MDNHIQKLYSFRNCGQAATWQRSGVENAKLYSFRNCGQAATTILPAATPAILYSFRNCGQAATIRIATIYILDSTHSEIVVKQQQREKTR